VTQVKICGLTNAEDAQDAAESGADLLGFHFCESMRRVTPDTAARIIQSLKTRPKVVGVFIDPSEDEAESIADFCGLDVLQLHGSESPRFRSRHSLMKVFKVRDAVIPDTSDWPDPIVLDSWSQDQRGGTGRPWTWSDASEVIRTRQVFIAGGLRPENVGAVVREFQPFGVDVSSGVEAKVRRKDHAKVQAFIRAVKQVDSERAG
jgi:phosphoribosylanthranilate isomerase